LKGIFHLTH